MILHEWLYFTAYRTLQHTPKIVSYLVLERSVSSNPAQNPTCKITVLYNVPIETTTSHGDQTFQIVTLLQKSRVSSSDQPVPASNRYTWESSLSTSHYFIERFAGTTPDSSTSIHDGAGRSADVDIATNRRSAHDTETGLACFEGFRHRNLRV